MRASSFALGLVIALLSINGVFGQWISTCCDNADCSGRCVEDYCDAQGYCHCHCELSGGAIAGIVIGCLAITIICAILCRRRYVRQRLYYARQPAVVIAPAYQPPMYAVAPAQVAYAPYQQPNAPVYQGQPQQMNNPQGYVQQPQQQQGTYAQM